MITTPVIRASERTLIPLGFIRKATTFRRVKDGVWQIINFQKGHHGGSYFFVNLGLHPNGLPLLQANRLKVPDSPEEYECFIRNRVERVCEGEPFISLKLASFNDSDYAEALAIALADKASRWLDSWSDLNRLAMSSLSDVDGLLPVVPVLREKSFAMAQCFSAAKCGDAAKAAISYEAYLAAPSAGYSFVELDEYLKKITRPVLT